MKLKILQEFKEFAVKGNMIDIAIGVIIGASFNKVVDALVKQVFLPPLSLLTNGLNWENKKLILRHAVAEDGVKIDEVAIGYGKLVEAGVDFIIIGFVVFLIVKLMNKLKTKAQNPKDKAVVTPKDIEFLYNISEIMEKQLAIMEEQKLKK